ncbi:dimethylargininase [Kitasatospora sp. NPDC088351]|uniref:dimethylargininase n=1 Tax=Kitasatospora sp. NPDC088351 TaxID=3155180 RepID=UPI0034126F60
MTAPALALSSPAAAPTRPRTSRPRRILMCRPEFFEVSYAINPWMNPDRPVDTDLATTQWERLRALYTEAGHTVELIDPVPGLPDMVYAANGATVIDGKVLGARFRNPERAAEGPAYLDWFRDRGFTETRDPRHVNEGAGDFLATDSWILAGHGFRSSPESHREAQEFFGRPVLGLELTDPRYYHLDTALAVLDGDEIMYNPAAFSPAARALLDRTFPDALLATPEDAAVFGLNAFSDGRDVYLPEPAHHLAARLRARGFRPRPVDLSELLKGGGSIKCCTLELRP